MGTSNNPYHLNDGDSTEENRREEDASQPTGRPYSHGSRGEDGLSSSSPSSLVSHSPSSHSRDRNNTSATAATVSSSQRKMRRNRTVFTELQLMGLERRFDSQKYLSTPDRADLARVLGLTQLQVKTWYQVRKL